VAVKADEIAGNAVAAGSAGEIKTGTMTSGQTGAGAAAETGGTGGQNAWPLLAAAVPFEQQASRIQLGDYWTPDVSLWTSV
jgi:hypothetical protein